MYKVSKKTEGTFYSQGKTFRKGVEVVVDKETFEYLKKMFPGDFNFIEEKQKEEPKKQTTKRGGRTKKADS